MRSLGSDLTKTTAKLVEHPELVAERIITFAEIVGHENVIAGGFSNDFNLGDVKLPPVRPGRDAGDPFE
jgi:hypothetical protein